MSQTEVIIEIEGKKPQREKYAFTFICHEVNINTKRMEDEFYKKVKIKFKKKTILYELQIIDLIEKINLIHSKINEQSFELYFSKKYPDETYIKPIKNIKSPEDASRYLRMICTDIVFRLENNRSVKEELETRFLARIYNAVGDLHHYFHMRYGISIKQKKILYTQIN